MAAFKVIQAQFFFEFAIILFDPPASPGHANQTAQSDGGATQIAEDDFLLTTTDISWFRSTFGSNLTIYPDGGHLGNLHIPAVQEALVRLFSDKGAK
jgi:hypothetical protein